MYNKSKSDVAKVLNRIANYIELAIAFVLVAGILVLLVQMVYQYGGLVMNVGSFDFSEFLSNALNLIIGLEFTRMLCRHSPDTIIEVLLFATARQLIVDHSSELGTFLGILSIGILFVVRKYLLPQRTGGGFYLNSVLRPPKKTGPREPPSQEESG